VTCLPDPLLLKCRYDVGEIPSLFLVDPEGLIVHKEVGYREDLYEIISSIFTVGS